MSEQIKLILIKARALIADRGHAIGDDQVWAPDHQFGYCVATACGSAGRASDYYLDVVDVFITANGIGDAIGDWSDTHTKEEVLAAFDKAIEAAP